MDFSFELVLTWIVIITGIITCIDALCFSPKRLRRLPELNVSKKTGIRHLPRSFVRFIIDILWWKKDGDWERVQKRQKITLSTDKIVLRPPVVIEYCRSFFPVLLLVLVLRSFLFEPYLIPSGSLEPTLLPGDFVLVNKFDYGLRLPVNHWKFIANNEPVIGDIVVFRFPPNPSINYIKRTIGVPGDKISYIDKVFYINGKKQSQTFVEHATDDYIGHTVTVNVMEEDLNGIKHKIYINPDVPVKNFYDITVPQGYYFMVGDNRDNSIDSRYWGYMPEENIIGKATVIWLSKVPNQFALRWHRLGQRIH